jgi:cell division protein FtsB
MRRRPVGLLGNAARERRRRIIRYTLLGVSFVFMVNSLVGENGLLTSIKSRRRYAQVQNQLIKLRLENQALLDEMRRLRDDPAAIEEAARRDLGLIRAGETLVIVRDSK